MGLAGIQYGQTEHIAKGRKRKRERGRGIDRLLAICPPGAFNVIVSSRYLKLHLAWTVMHDSECLNPGAFVSVSFSVWYALQTALTPKQSSGCNGNGSKRKKKNCSFFCVSQ